MSKGASFHRGESEQSVSTPGEFIEAVERRFGSIAFDLAADSDNHKASDYFDVCRDSLAQDWEAIRAQVKWLNPPFANIAPWAAKCAERKHDPRWTLLLVPASVGSVWFQTHVAPHSLVLDLRGRLTFEGHDNPYPKDLILACYGYGVVGRALWDWRRNGS